MKVFLKQNLINEICRKTGKSRNMVIKEFNKTFLKAAANYQVKNNSDFIVSSDSVKKTQMENYVLTCVKLRNLKKESRKYGRRIDKKIGIKNSKIGIDVGPHIINK